MAPRPVRTLTVDASKAGLPLLDYLLQCVYGLEPDKGRALLARGAIWVGKHRCHDAAYRIKAGETILVCAPPTGVYDEPVVTADQILHDDAALLAVAKPSGWYTQATPWDLHGNLAGAVARFLAPRPGGAGFLHLVNRLDHETSGIVLFARKKDLAAPLQATWSSKGVIKQYLAIVTGHWESDLTIDQPIASAGRAKFHCHPKGKEAQTVFRPLAYGDGWSLVSAEPLTGRTHQIRVHAAFHGHPLLGDGRYGGGKGDPERIPHEFLLHAHRLAFTLQGRAYDWQAPVPPAFAAFVAESERAREVIAGY